MVHPLRSRVMWIGSGLLLAAGLVVSRSGADDPAPAAVPPAVSRDAELRTFMRKKLAASNQILEGLATDDLTLVKAGANVLSELSQAERWRVTNDPLYRQFSGEFREITRQIAQAADDGNADRAAIKWMDATLSCLDCHRYVRRMSLAQETRP